MDAACDLCRRALCAEPSEPPGAEPRLDPVAHLAACPSCRAFGEAMGSGLGDLRSMAGMAPAGSPLGRAMAVAAQPRRAPRWPFALAASAAVAAAAWLAVVRPLPQSTLQEAADKAATSQAAGPAAMPAAKEAARQLPGTDRGSRARRGLRYERRSAAPTTRRDAAAGGAAERQAVVAGAVEPARPRSVSLRAFGAEARPVAADAVAGMPAPQAAVAGPAAAPALAESRNVDAYKAVSAAPVTLTLAEMPAPELAARLAKALERPLRVDPALAEVRLALRCVERPASEVLQAVAAATEARWTPATDALLLTQAVEAEEAAAAPGPVALKTEASAVGGRMGGAVREMRAQEGSAAPTGMAGGLGGGAAADGVPAFGRGGSAGFAKQDRALAAKMQASRPEPPRNAVTVRWPHGLAAARARRGTAPALPPNWVVTTEAGAQAGKPPAGR
ncbi:MAG: hypothetical protein NT029_10735 [Armatimonadetes bacterium]|nr:hypothetical protein [Armatimonadota bacterium]